MPPANPVDLVWTASALLGLSISLFAQWEALVDWLWWRGVYHPRGLLLRMLAASHLRRALIHCLTLTLFIALGLLELSGAPIERIKAVKVAAVASVTVNAVLDWADRRALLRRLQGEK